jgi:hypothetical protein
MSVKVLTETLRIVLDQVSEEQTENQLYNAMFDEVVNTPNASSVPVDLFTDTPESMRVIKQGEPSITVPYVPGKSQVFTPDISSEKTPVDQQLFDSRLFGRDPQEVADQYGYLIRRILNGPTGFVNRKNMSKNKSTIDVLREGKFLQYDKNGNLTTGLDYGRDASLDTTYDFNVTGANIDKNLNRDWKLLQAQGCPTSNMLVIMGDQYLERFQTDSVITDKLIAYDGSFINLIPERWRNVHGLGIIGRYRPNGSLVTFTIASYSPQYQFSVAGSTPGPYIPTDEYVMFDMSGPRTQVNTGILVHTNRAQGLTEGVAGDLVITDAYQDDPVIKWVVGKFRTAFFLHPNHTLRCTGSNF